MKGGGRGVTPLLLCIVTLAHFPAHGSVRDEHTCPDWGGDSQHEYCELWKDSVRSIPYGVPWTVEHKDVLNDSMMQHCKVPGRAQGRLCCPDKEFTCLIFTEERQRLHDAIAAKIRRGCGDAGAEGRRPSLYIVAGVPGTGKTGALRHFASEMLAKKHGGGGELCLVSSDHVKEFLAEGSTLDESGEMVMASDELSERVKRVVASSSLKLPLVHSQYLHRESIYLADQIFADAVRQGRHILLEKTMTSYEQVRPYIESVQSCQLWGCEEDAPGGRDGGGNVRGYNAVVLAAVADWAHCVSANERRMSRGHSVTTEQLWWQYRAFNHTITALAREPPEGVKVWVLDTGEFLEAMVSGEELVVARERIRAVHWPNDVSWSDLGEVGAESQWDA